MVLDFDVDDKQLVKTTFWHHAKSRVRVKDTLRERGQLRCDRLCRKNRKAVFRFLYRAAVEQRRWVRRCPPIVLHDRRVLERSDDVVESLRVTGCRLGADVVVVSSFCHKRHVGTSDRITVQKNI